MVATDDVTATRADAVVSINPDAVGRTVRQILDDERIERTRRRVGRAVQLAADLDGSDDAESVCERLADGVGYDTAWLVRREGDSIVPSAAAGIPAAALGTVPADAKDSWARALRSGESIVEAGNLSTVAVPFEDHCLICTTDSAVGETEVSAVEHVVWSTSAVSGSLQPRYALLGKAIAHEVNNQLDVAMVHLDLADGVDDYLEHVEAAMERIDAVIDEVNALVAPELSVDEVSLRDVSVEVWNDVSTADASLEGTDATIEAGGRLLRLLLSNLFRNAIQHGGDEVTVRVGPLEGCGYYVADDGSGFADGIGEQLYEWGWSDEGGTGIGLALVLLVADRHGWDVEHCGEEGARFEFRP